MEILELMIQKGIFEIEYENSVGIITNHIISDVKLSGENYIKACSCKSGDDLTFKIERIRNVQQIWRPILDKDSVAPKSGLYVFLYESDNHLDFEAFELLKGENLF